VGIDQSPKRGDNKVLSSGFLPKPKYIHITPSYSAYKRTAAPRTPIATTPVMPAVTIGARPVLVAPEAAGDVTVLREPNSEFAPVVVVAEASVTVGEWWAEEPLAL
jgi:hypothetical protein